VPQEVLDGIAGKFGGANNAEELKMMLMQMASEMASEHGGEHGGMSEEDMAKMA
jgi:hypothetical protein